ncbi:MAG: hypothetical protein C4319_06730 [Acidimicrobiia bacterium]
MPQRRHVQPGRGLQRGAGRIRSSLRKLFGRRERAQHAVEDEWYIPPEYQTSWQGPSAEILSEPDTHLHSPSQWILPSPTEESLRRAEERGFVTAAGLSSRSGISSEEPYRLSQPVIDETEISQPRFVSKEPESSAGLPEWVISEYVESEAAIPSAPKVLPPQTEPDDKGVSGGVPSPKEGGDASFTIVEHSTEPIGGYLADLGLEQGQRRPVAEQPPPAPDEYRFSKQPDRDTLEAVYLPAAPPEPFPGTEDAFGSVEQPAPPEPPPPPPIAVAKSTGSFEAVDEKKPTQPSALSASSAGKDRAASGGRIGQKLHGPPAFAAEPDIRHVVLGFKDGTAVFLEPEHPLFSLFFQWSELVAGPETPPKAYARRQAQHKIYLGKPPRGKPKKSMKKKAGG